MHRAGIRQRSVCGIRFRSLHRLFQAAPVSRSGFGEGLSGEAAAVSTERAMGPEGQKLRWFSV